VRDIRPEAVADSVTRSAVVCVSAADLAQRCRVMVVLVLDAVQIDEVLFGDGGAFGRLQPKSLVFLCSTIAPTDAESFAAMLKERGVFALDAPISGGPAKALSGTMSMMLAAKPAALSKAASVLPFLTENVFHVSDRPGDDARFKLLNNMLATTNLAAGAEAMALGMKMGLDPMRLLEVISASSGSSWVLRDRMPRALAGDFAPRAATKILTKDVSLFTELARSEHFPSLIAGQTLQVFQAALANGLAEEDDASLLTLYRRLTQLS